VGVNEHCQVEVMDIDSITTFLTLQNPEDILCLGSRKGMMANVLNQLETICPEKYNKTTVYASINDDDAGTVNPKKENAIFTTFDSSKGLERRICVVFDYSEDYWEVRRNSPLQSYRILRNIFCVAASRGKDRIIFANEGRKILSEETLSKSFDTNERQKNLDISSMFDFKHKESIEKCFSMLKIREISENMDHSPIPIKNHDGLIDLSPCIGMYQEASFFTGFNIDEEIHFLEILEKRALLTPCIQALSLDEKILYVMSVDKKQDRYRTQVQIPFVLEPEKKQLDKRLGSIFTGNEDVQVPCVLKKDSLCVQGLADVVKDQTVYELKFVSELKH
jgi:3-phenylpropionate/cinnamic acid dioxygenase small subunit